MRVKLICSLIDDCRCPGLSASVAEEFFLQIGTELKNLKNFSLNLTGFVCEL